ncbi:MAG TPA: trypsin-like peptidase domain-containing protein [Phycisphaerae bacterium]|nr:trypsin-like peptidase domain-containing protein [Phycisphaerae bacterium]
MTPSTARRTPQSIALLAFAVLTIALAGTDAPAQVRSQPLQIRDLRQLESAFVRLAEQARPSAVAIRTYSLGPYIGSGRERSGHPRMRWARSHGSGAVISRDGQILTSSHVIAGADEIIVVLYDGREFDAKLIQADQRSDLAVVKIEVPFVPPVHFGSFDQVQQGQWCFAIGNPFGLANRDGRTGVTYGIVSAVGKDLSRELNDGLEGADERYYGNLIQTSAAINPGNSGGPLFNIDGEMIGLVTAIRSRSGVTEGVGFAIPMEPRNRNIVQTLIAGEPVRYGFLGVQIDNPDAAARRAAGLTARAGALVRSVSPANGPAARAGLQRGDVIIEFDGVAITDTDHLVRTIGATPVGTPATIVYKRNGQRGTTTATLAVREVSPVLAGGDQSTGDEPRTSRWRGAWLAEPTDAVLAEFGLTRDQAGLVVVAVDADSDAETAGIEPQQIILKFNRRRVRTIEEFLAADDRVKSPVTLQVSSEGETRTISLSALDRSL